MNKTLNFAAVVEVLTGLAMLIVPSLVGQLMFGQQLAGVGNTRRPRNRDRIDRSGNGLLACHTAHRDVRL